MKSLIVSLIVLVLIVSINKYSDAMSEPVSSRIYWTSLNKIQRANLDGSNVKDLVVTAKWESPEGIALDVENGKIYWTNSSSFTNIGKIQRANLDGSNVEDLVTGLSHPQSIALDVENGKIYWTDWRAWPEWHPGQAREMGLIQRADLDGSNVEDLITGVSFGIALDVVNGKIYWTAWRGLIRLSKPALRCADLDGSNVKDLITGLSHPQGLALDVVNGKIYWTDTETGKIQRADLDGSNVKDLITGLSSPQGVELGP